MADNHDDLDKQIATKKDEWIQARTAELGGRGSAANTRRVTTELNALEARKKQQETHDKTPSNEQEQERSPQRNQMVRQLRMSRSR